MDASRLKFLRLLSTLRSVALPGQALAITVALYGLGLPLHATPLWLGVLLLALFQLWVFWRLQRPQSLHPRELALHLGTDLAALTWLLFWSGGSANPFVSLYLVPIALAAVGLPGAWVWAVGAASGLAYVLMALFAPPFPHVHGDVSLGFDRHLWGMAINFGLSALCSFWCCDDWRLRWAIASTRCRRCASRHCATRASWLWAHTPPRWRMS